MLQPLFGIPHCPKIMPSLPKRLSPARNFALGLTALALSLAFSAACANDASTAPGPPPLTVAPPAPAAPAATPGPTAANPPPAALPTAAPPPTPAAPTATPLSPAANPTATPPPPLVLPTVSLPADFIPFVRLAAGSIVQCGLRADGRLSCRGKDNQRVPQVWSAARFRQVTVGQAYACGLLMDGVLSCWGAATYGKTAAPPGQFTAVAAGKHHACALDTAGYAQCWGFDAQGRTNPPAGVAFTAIAAGGAHSCGLTVAGALRCWGNNVRGQANNHPGPFQALTLGRENTCALRLDGAAWCQGNDAAGQSSPPPGAFTQIAAGEWHTCGLRPEGRVECWGGDFGVELAAPAGRFTALSGGGVSGGAAINGDEDLFCALAAGYPVCWRYRRGFPQPAAEPVEIAYTEASGEDLQEPVDLLPWPGGSLAVVEREGLILLCDYRAEVYCELSGNPPILDLTDRTDTTAAESGLLSAALDPDFDRHPFLYVYYTLRANPRKVRLSRFPVAADRADPAAERVLLELPMPDAYHFGGGLRFGPDGMLYLGIGDNRTAEQAQNPASMRGKILRINIRSPNPEQPEQAPAANPPRPFPESPPEIWASGLQNPWRMSFDAAGRLWVGDVGSMGAKAAEEISIAPAGANLGWPLFEGHLCYGGETQCAALTDYAPPLATYGRAEGCAIIWGGQYRGANLPRLVGSYLFADYCRGQIWALTPEQTGGWSRRLIATGGQNIIAFGADAAGEMYLLSPNRQLLKLDPAFSFDD